MTKLTEIRARLEDATVDAVRVAILTEENAELKARTEKLEAALKEVAEAHFDGKVEHPQIACGYGCDMGDSGRPTDEHGHDIDCIFGRARRALAQLDDEETKT